MQRPLPFAVLEVIGNLKRNRYMSGRWDLGYSYASENKVARQEAIRIIESIGGAQTSPGFLSSITTRHRCWETSSQPVASRIKRHTSFTQLLSVWL